MDNLQMVGVMLQRPDLYFPAGVLLPPPILRLFASALCSSYSRRFVLVSL